MEYCSEIVASVGLLMDIFGILLLFKFGAIGGKWILAGDSPYRQTVTDELATERNERRAHFCSRLGIALATLGFLLQIVAQWL